MPEVTPLSSRKADHIRINLDENVRSGLTTGLERVYFVHQALPEINLDDVDLSMRIFGRELRSPLLISSMTGGTPQAGQINRRLAEAAQETGVAIAVGSQRVALEHPGKASSFQVRQWAPTALVFANLGAVQLNYGYELSHCQRAVDMLGADALILHLNPLQEAVQPEGDTQFAGLLTKIEKVCHHLGVPVIAKEVGWGISTQTARQLAEAGVAAIDVAGAGGTSWSQVEMHRAETPRQAQLAAAFIDWGIPTAESIIQVHQALPQMVLFASGGLRDGVDVAKCLALGASLGGMASIFLKAAVQSTDHVIEIIQLFSRQLQVAMFAAGARDIEALRAVQLQINK